MKVKDVTFVEAIISDVDENSITQLINSLNTNDYIKNLQSKKLPDKNGLVKYSITYEIAK